jgi:hypothetical protein
MPLSLVDPSVIHRPSTPNRNQSGSSHRSEMAPPPADAVEPAELVTPTADTAYDDERYGLCAKTRDDLLDRYTGLELLADAFHRVM